MNWKQKRFLIYLDREKLTYSYPENLLKYRSEIENFVKNLNIRCMSCIDIIRKDLSYVDIREVPYERGKLRFYPCHPFMP